ncbi:hypothetical protein [Zobellella maritima]|uniref:hypothetical protein n=1 Tax=Zobellella maritima TaxID=2059725 RepID=UPI000E3040AF|nr:hypothetical protein [Zobellella maritima]
MKPFHEFCQHHELNPTTAEARDQYAVYQRQLDVYREAAGLGIKSQSFTYDGGELELIQTPKSRFILMNLSAGLYAQCHRDHLLVECWQGEPEVGHDEGAQLLITAEDGLRLAFSGIPFEDAPRLAWFLGVELVEDDE